MGLTAALSRFSFTLSLIQNPAEVRRVAREICEDANAESVSTLEIRFAPQLHLGGSPETIVDAALEGISESPLPHTGLILCGLYGEPVEVLTSHVEIARTRPGVVGIDLAGGPSPAHTVRLEDYAGPFRKAEDLGLGRTVHAGEGRPPAEIRVACELLRAQRIGHGTTLLDDPSVLAYVVNHGICIEACLTSNVHTDIISRIEDHPLPKWLDLGVITTICTDNTLLSDTTWYGEYVAAHRIPGMTEGHLTSIVRNGHASQFRR